MFLTAKTKLKLLRKKKEISKTIQTSARLTDNEKKELKREINSVFEKLDGIEAQKDFFYEIQKDGIERTGSKIILDQSVKSYIQGMVSNRAHTLLKKISIQYGEVFEEYLKKKLMLNNDIHKSKKLSNFDDFFTVVTPKEPTYVNLLNRLSGSTNFISDRYKKMTQESGALAEILRKYFFSYDKLNEILEEEVGQGSDWLSNVRTDNFTTIKNELNINEQRGVLKNYYYILSEKVFHHRIVPDINEFVKREVWIGKDHVEIDVVDHSPVVRVDYANNSITVRVRLGEIKASYSMKNVQKGVIQLSVACAFISHFIDEVYGSLGFTVNKEFDLRLYTSYYVQVMAGEVGKTVQEVDALVFDTENNFNLWDVSNLITYAPNTTFNLDLYRLGYLHKTDWNNLDRTTIISYP